GFCEPASPVTSMAKVARRPSVVARAPVMSKAGGTEGSGSARMSCAAASAAEAVRIAAERMVEVVAETGIVHSLGIDTIATRYQYPDSSTIQLSQRKQRVAIMTPRDALDAAHLIDRLERLARSGVPARGLNP